MKKTLKKVTCLVALCAAAMSAQADVTIEMGSGAGHVPGTGGLFNSNAFSNTMNNTSEASSYTTGTFSTLPSGNPGSGVSFDVVAVASSGGFRAQPDGLGVQGGSADSAIDNNNGNGPLEWVSFQLANVTGLGAGDELVITSAKLRIFSPSQVEASYRLDVGSAGSAPVAGNVLGGNILTIGRDAFTLGAGPQDDVRFVVESISVDRAPRTANLTIDPSSVIRQYDRKPIGITLSYLSDSDVHYPRPKTLDAALKDLQVGTLRFPMGTLATQYLFEYDYVNDVDISRSSVDGPARLAPGFQNALTTKEYIKLTEKLGVTPFFMVGIGALEKDADNIQRYIEPNPESAWPNSTAVSRARIVQAAVEWVTYVKDTLGVTGCYWEIGNENYLRLWWMDKYAGVVNELSDAIKAVDPTAKVGANGGNAPDSTWWRTLMPLVEDKVDFFIVHDYTREPANDYSVYINYQGGLMQKFTTEAIRDFNNFVKPANRARIGFAVTETSALTPGETAASSLGSAIRTFDKHGHALREEKIDYVHLWATRNHSQPQQYQDSRFAALDPDNNRKPLGTAVKLWGHFLHDQLVAASSSRSPQIKPYATRRSSDGALNLLLVNRERGERTVRVSLGSYSGSPKNISWRFGGTSDTDTNPPLEMIPSVAVSGNEFVTTLAPVSITVISFQPDFAAGDSYYIVNDFGDKLLETEDPGVDGTPAQLWSNRGVEWKKQGWAFEPDGQGGFEIINQANLGTFHRLEADGTSVIGSTDKGNDARQQWLLEPDASGAWVIRNRATGEALGALNGQTPDGTYASTAPFTGSRKQLWHIVPYGDRISTAHVIEPFDLDDPDARVDVVVAGWGFGVNTNATHTMAGVTASQLIGSAQTRTNSWNSSDVGSDDGTFGTGVGLGFSPLDQAPATGTGLLVIGNTASDSVLNRFTVQNNTGADLELSQVQFDYFRDGEGAHSQIRVTVEDGSDITVGEVFDSGLIAVDTGATWSDFPDYMIDLTGLADHTLGVGENATFGVRFFSSDKTGNGLFDNFAVTGIPGETPEGLVAIQDALAGRAGSANGNGITGTQVNLDRFLEAGVYDNGFHAHPVFVFQMTGVAAPANITNTNFSVGLVEKVGTFTFSADAHVIRKNASSTILASDYETSEQLLMSGFNESGDTAGPYSLDATGQAILGTWLKDNWVEGEYVFIGLKTDPLALPTGANRFYRYSGGAFDSAWSEGKTNAQLTIEVLTTDPYTLWATDNGVGAMDEDFDKDGLVNLVEYALGGNPTNEDDSGLLPTQVETVDGLNYVFRRRLDPAAAGLSYTVETSTSLASGDWTETGTVEIDTDEIDTEFESVINAVDTTGKPALFIRLKIEAE